MVRTETWGGDELNIWLDVDGYVVMERQGFPDFMVHPDKLRGALRELGVIPANESGGSDITARVARLEERLDGIAETNGLWDGS